MARQWARIQEIALRKFRARPECERASDGVSAAPDVSAGAAPAADAGGAAGRGLNRRCWSEAMVEAESAHGQLPLGKALYAWYKGISDSTCDVERLIRNVNQHIKVKHADIGSLLLRDCVTIDAFWASEEGRLRYTLSVPGLAQRAPGPKRVFEALPRPVGTVFWKALLRELDGAFR